MMEQLSDAGRRFNRCIESINYKANGFELRFEPHGGLNWFARTGGRNREWTPVMYKHELADIIGGGIDHIQVKLKPEYV